MGAKKKFNVHLKNKKENFGVGKSLKKYLNVLVKLDYKTRL